MDRFDFWADFIERNDIRTMAEIGVWRGEFAAGILERCPGIERYYLIDPWRQLKDWNKPFARQDAEEAYRDARKRLEPFEIKCVYLRGKTTEVDIPEVDFAYIDGDHTLRGIAIDLIRIWPKAHWVGGDDFTLTIWQHSDEFEPTMVFPFAVYFAEAVDAPITAYRRRQFLIGGEGGFSFSDQTGRYGDLSILGQVRSRGC